MHVLIAGGTGLIGRRLIDDLVARNHKISVLSRRPIKPAALSSQIGFVPWDGATAAGWGRQLEQVDAVVNLAGAGIADERWTDERKKALLNSRLAPGRAMVEAFGAAANRPEVLVQASAVGYYGSQGDAPITEEHGPGRGFLADICVRWEASTQPVEALGVRRVVIRTGVVLDTAGGALPKMVTPFKFLAGGPVGSGRQWFPWIHYADAAAAITFLLETEAASGPVNLTAPNPLTNREFAREIGRALRRPALAVAPGVALKAMFGEMASVLLEGQRALPARLQALGYQFKFATAGAALANLLRP